MKVIAHRGNSKFFPENTLASYKSGIETQADIIETDIHISSDGTAVIIHDKTGERTTGEDKIIKEMTLTEIKALDAGYARVFGDKFRGEKIPTVKEVLMLLKEHNAKCILELKDINARHAVKADLEETGYPEEDSIIFVWSDEDTEKACEVFKKAPVWHLAPLKGFIPAPDKEEYFKHLRDIGVKGFSIKFVDFFNMPNADINMFAGLAEKYHMPFFVWTLDDPADMKKALDFKPEITIDGIVYKGKISGIISNDPKTALEVVRSYEGK